MDKYKYSDLLKISNLFSDISLNNSKILEYAKTLENNLRNHGTNIIKCVEMTRPLLMMSVLCNDNFSLHADLRQHVQTLLEPYQYQYKVDYWSSIVDDLLNSYWDCFSCKKPLSVYNIDITFVNMFCIVSCVNCASLD